MNFIFVVLCLNFINIADCIERIFEGCEDSLEIYVQWYPPISGWYTKNLSTKNEYSRTPPNMTDLNRYEFLLDRDEWNLIQWANWSKSIEFRKKDKEMISKMPMALNTDYVPILSRRKRGGRREGLTYSKKSKDKTTPGKETPTKSKFSKTIVGNSNINENQENRNKTSFDHNVPELNVYCPRRCQCRKAKVENAMGGFIEFTRYDLVADTKTKKACWEKIVNATELPEENKDVYRIIDSNNIDIVETFSSINPNQWKPELYVSENCDVLHYNKHYDNWIVDFGWEVRSCNIFSNSGAGLDYYISNNSAPCIEYLPKAPDQQWSNSQPYHNGSESTEEDPLLIDDITEYCGFNFTMKPNIYFKVICSEIE